MAQSRDGGNPFAEPSELDNPFQPPPAYEPPAPAPLPPPSAPSLQPSRKLSPTEPKNYGSYSTQASAAAATAELLKKQEELNRKAEELDRRERELQHAALGGTARHLHGDPPRISEDCIHHVLPLDVQHAGSSPELPRLPGQLLCGNQQWRRLWAFYPLGPPFHSLLLCLLVPPHV
uniref:Secretory carrier membrane protein 3 n=1 Tax=Homo sapiens TaxID=9606 RepID=A0AAQ5BHL8_HUMAN